MIAVVIVEQKRSIGDSDSAQRALDTRLSQSFISHRRKASTVNPKYILMSILYTEKSHNIHQPPPHHRSGMCRHPHSWFAPEGHQRRAHGISRYLPPVAELFQGNYIRERVIKKVMVIIDRDPGRKFFDQRVQPRSRLLF